MTTHDAEAAKKIARYPDVAVAWYLMASYAYYELADPLLSDGFFDRLCVTLLERLRAGLIDHPHVHLVTEGNLQAGTCLGVEYPLMTKGAAHQLLGLPRPHLEPEPKPIRKRTRK